MIISPKYNNIANRLVGRYSWTSGKWTWFISTLVLGLLPAVINGYPFYFEDSTGYDGHGLPFNLRSDIPTAISGIIYPVFGVWSLAIINGIMFAYIVARFAQLFLPSTPLFVGLLFILLSGAPFYVSLLAPDIWIVILGLCVAMLIVRFSWFDFAIAVIACSGHGSSVYILAATGLWLLLLARRKARYALMAGAISACSIAVVFLVDIWMHGTYADRLSQATIASKIMNDVPEALEDYCNQLPEEKICQLRDRVNALPPHSYDDAQYMWHAKLRDEPGTLSWPEFNALGLRLLGFVLLSRHAPSYLIESFYDYINFFNPDRCLGFPGYVSDAAEQWDLRHYAEGDRNSLARAGVFTDNVFCFPFYILTITVFVLGLIVFIWHILHTHAQDRDLILLLFFISLSNDAFFALFSGGYTRYHLRALMLVGTVILIALDRYLREKQPIFL
jgi:hypothetical protein